MQTATIGDPAAIPAPWQPRAATREAAAPVNSGAAAEVSLTTGEVTASVTEMAGATEMTTAPEMRTGAVTLGESKRRARQTERNKA